MSTIKQNETFTAFMEALPEIKEDLKSELATKEDLRKEISILSKKLDIFIIVAIILMVLFSPVVTTVASKLLAFIK